MYFTFNFLETVQKYLKLLYLQSSLQRLSSSLAGPLQTLTIPRFLFR